MDGNIILDSSQIEKKLNRISYQIIEDNFNQSEIILAGLAIKGNILANRISDKIKKLCDTKVTVISIDFNKENNTGLNLQGNSIIIIDDILNTGQTMLKAINSLFTFNLYKIRTAVLINRSHQLFPVHIDFCGLELSTVKEEYVIVKLKETDNIDVAILK